MTKDKFAMLCEQVLVPRIGDLINEQLTELHSAIEAMMPELIRIGRYLEKMSPSGATEQSHADRR